MILWSILKMVAHVASVGVLIFLIHTCTSQTGDNVKELRNDLFVVDKYDKRVRPLLNQTLSSGVHVAFNLLSIDYLDEVTETLKTTGYLSIRWVDEYLAWNPSSYGGISSGYWPQDDVWKPDIALTNSYKEYKELGASSMSVHVLYDGTVRWFPFQVFISTCSVDIKYFPFDIQTCHLKFVAWSYPKTEVVLLSEESGISLNGYKGSSSWEVMEANYAIDWTSLEAAITFTLKLKRKPLHFFLSVHIPIILLSLLNIFVFVLPCESGERSCYAITVFLAFAVFLTIVSASLPETSDTVAIFSVFILIQTIQSTLITLIALILIRMHFFDDDKTIPKPLLVLARLAMFDTSLKAKIGSVNPQSPRRESIESIEKIDQVKVREDSDDKNKYTWKYVIKGIDRFCFVMFLIIFLVATLVCIVASVTGN